MEKTPLLDALLEHARMDPAPFHMPGHKGRMKEFEKFTKVSALDVTELPDTGDLYRGRDAIEEAERLWSEAWDFPLCQFLTGGSTQGIHAAMLLCARHGKEILVDRCSHRSVYNALGMYHMEPTYFMRCQDEPISPKVLWDTLKAAAAQGKEIRTVCITSPTYYGVLSDVPALAMVAHTNNCRLIVDAAHGCHLPFMMENPYWSVNSLFRPDLVVTSAHKTLPVYGQGALLFGNDRWFEQRDLRWAASVCGTSSPSYAVMSSMDWARAYMERESTRRNLDSAAEAVRTFQGSYAAIRGPHTDPLRLTLTVDATEADGFFVKERLEALGVFPEMADRDHVVFLFSTENTSRDLERLDMALAEVRRDFPHTFGQPFEHAEPPEPEVVCSPAQALTGRRRQRILKESVGQVAAQQIASYPPGVPVVAPGERITKKCLAYLENVGYNVHQWVDVLTLPEPVDADETGDEPGDELGAGLS